MRCTPSARCCSRASASRSTGPTPRRAHADQGGLFDFVADTATCARQHPGAGAGRRRPWSIKERLTLEKAALGFYLSGHLFDQSAAEVRRFAKVRLADVIDSASRCCSPASSPTCASSTAMRGRVAIFKLDDGSEAMEAVANEELLTANRELLKDDELVIVQGKVQPDRFSGGVRLNVQSVWDLAARALPLRQVPAGRGQRQRAAGGRGAARVPVAPPRHRARRDAAGAGGAAGACCASMRPARSISATRPASILRKRRWRAGTRRRRTAAPSSSTSDAAAPAR